MTTSRLRPLAMFAAALVLLLGACSSDDDSSDVSTDASDEVADADAEVAIDEVWARTSADGQENGAAYLVITGGADDDALVGASVDESIAATVELHETVPVESGDVDDAADDMGGMGDDAADDMGGMGDDAADDGADHMGGMAEGMTMQAVPVIEVPAGQTVVLEPGGLHVMLLDLAEPLVEGQTFELTLIFEQAGEITVPVEVRDR